jgi:hypothetical protein
VTQGKITQNTKQKKRMAAKFPGKFNYLIHGKNFTSYADFLAYVDELRGRYRFVLLEPFVYAHPSAKCFSYKTEPRNVREMELIERIEKTEKN